MKVATTACGIPIKINSWPIRKGAEILPWERILWFFFKAGKWYRSRRTETSLSGMHYDVTLATKKALPKGPRSSPGAALQVSSNRA